MKARSSSYHAFLGRATGHVRRASRTAGEFTHAVLSAAGSPGGDGDSHTPPSWLDFSPRGDGHPASARHPAAAKRARAQFAPPAVLRHNKSAQRLFADARVAVKTRARGLDRRILLGGVLLFFPVFFVLYFLLQRSYGVRGLGTTAPRPDTASNLRRMREGLPPEEFWPFRIRTRLHHLTPFPRPVQLKDVINARNRIIPPGRDYRVVSKRAADGGPPSTFPVRVSLIAACRDRTGFLQTALPTWLDALTKEDEVVLVDWGTNPDTHVPLMAVVEAAKDPRISLITVRNTTAWVLTHAYNLALRQARGEWILKVDCDTILTTSFLHFHSLPPSPAAKTATTENIADDSQSLTSSNTSAEAPFYYSFSPHDSQQENQQHLTGVLLIRSDDLRAVHGYDERIATYGWDTSDLYSRLERNASQNGRGLHHKHFVAHTAVHIAHSTEFSAGDQPLVSGPALETELNRLAIALLPAWHSVPATERSTYSYQLASNDATYVFATLTSAAPAALTLLPPEKRDSVLAAARDTLLHGVYGLPQHLLSEISRSRAELVRALDRMRRSGHWRPGTGVMFATVSGSSAQRVLGVASAAALAVEYNRPLFLAWESARPTAAHSSHSTRLADVFDLDRARDNGLHVFQLGAWRCRTGSAACAASDPAYSTIADFRAGQDAPKEVLDILQGRVGERKRNIALTLEGPFPNLPRKWLLAAIRKLPPAAAVGDAIAAAGALADARGVYVGQSMRARGVDAMARRLQAHASDGRPYFVAGAERAMVKRARAALGVSTQNGLDGAPRDIAEIYALAKCAAVVNDGRPHRDVLDAVALVKEALYQAR